MRAINPLTACVQIVTPSGIESITCKQNVPGGAKDWYVCIRPAAGKSYGNVDSGNESCTKP
jgi:hypothetical protein